MYKKFTHALTWNSINTVSYKIILIAHQIVLFYVIPKELYAISGTLFADLYLVIGFTNFGFEYSLFSFFNNIQANKKNTTYLIHQIALKIAITLTAAYILHHLLSNSKTINSSLLFNYTIPKAVTSCFIMIFITESIRKYIETIAQLAFLNKKIARIQIAMISLYVSAVWISYAIHKTISINILFAPLVATSILEVAWTSYALYQWHKSLPSANNNQTFHPASSFMIKQQIYNYINQLGKNLFSPNFLMVLIAFNVSMQKAADIRFFTNIITLLYMFFNKSVAIPSGALFASIAHQNFKKTQLAFIEITNKYIQLLYFLAIIILSTCFTQILTKYPENQTPYLILFFIFSGFIEYVTITYEKLYIVHNATQQLALINFLTASIFVVIIYTTKIPPTLLLLIACVIRIIATILISLYAHKNWSIFPVFRISKKTFMASILASLFINTIITYLF